MIGNPRYWESSRRSDGFVLSPGGRTIHVRAGHDDGGHWCRAPRLAEAVMARSRASLPPGRIADGGDVAWQRRQLDSVYPVRVHTSIVRNANRDRTRALVGERG